MSSVVVVMPAYNEASGIAAFLSELQRHLGRDAEFVVVDDRSNDGTAEVVRQCADDGVPVRLVGNPSNLGHGPSTMRAMAAGLENGNDIVVTIDGDGQFEGSDVARLVSLMVGDDRVEVIEGVRTQRSDPYFRRLTSAITRLLVWSRARQLPADANTPLRIYRAATLQDLLERLPRESMTPNLVMSVLVRTRGLALREEPVRSRVRRGGDAHGSTWQARHALIPSRRFLTFCLLATRQWVRLRGRAW
ncbi:glycosyltransferase family 2 protein [Nocardioides sp. zg-1230]|uniref:glycosyltransferase family 2 protein n=1 Tax=Nocardioides sp. zg-1230 TaxID=2736601 RepID=UPI0015552F8F|nr:glycosyltransferase family 2 protein [Nocardioides sp. zg-1230]NPC45073.1 glycosyltransferase family 2 protein [Nocardioides sp. zg-1230]